MTLINIYRLCDQRTPRPCDECCDLLDQAPQPEVWSFTAGEVEWLTDRFWILPRTAFADLTCVTVTKLPEVQAAKCVEWIEAARTGELTVTDHYFAPDFAGELQAHGLTLLGYKGEPERAAAIFNENGDRVGLLMTLREQGKDGVRSPVPQAVIDLQRRIEYLGVDVAKSWSLAASLA